MAQLYINPGFKADKREQYYYRSEGSAAKRIVIGERDLQGMKLKNDKLYIQVYCQNSCKYVIKAQKIVDSLFDLTPGYSETGYLVPGEIRQHIVKSKAFDGSQIEKRYHVKLQTFSGQGNL